MNKFLNISIILLTLITLINHFFIGLMLVGENDTQVLGGLFILSAFGLGILLASIFTSYIPLLSAKPVMAHGLFLEFTIFLIAAYIVSLFITDDEIMPGAIITKIDEILLVGALYFNLRRVRYAQ